MLDCDRYEGSIMHPQTPLGRRAFESWDEPVAQPASRARTAFLVLVVIVALILLL